MDENPTNSFQYDIALQLSCDTCGDKHVVLLVGEQPEAVNEQLAFSIGVLSFCLLLTINPTSSFCLLMTSATVSLAVKAISEVRWSRSHATAH